MRIIPYFRQRGKALIINNKNFTYSGGKTRDGTDFDRDSLRNTLGKLGFHKDDVIVKNDAKVAEMKSLMATSKSLSNSVGKKVKAYLVSTHPAADNTICVRSVIKCSL